MFTPLSAAEALQAGTAAKKAGRSEEAKRFTKKLAPWFIGLRTYVRPYRTNPAVPPPTLHEGNPYATTWPVRIEDGSGEPVVLLLLTWFVAGNIPAVLTDIQTFIGADPGDAMEARTLIEAYVAETLDGPMFQAQSTSMWKSTGRAEP